MPLRRWQREAGGGPLFPLTLSGALFSYRLARDLVTLDGSGNVELVVDELNRGNAANDQVQTTVADRPAFEATGVNGQPAARFDGVTEFLATASPPSWVGQAYNGDLQVYAVLEFATNASNFMGPAGSSAGTAVRSFRGATGGPRFQTTANATSADTFLGGEVGWLRGIQDVSDAMSGTKIQTNKGAAALTTWAAGAANLDRGVLGCRLNAGAATNLFTGALAWMFAYDRLLTAGESAAVESWLSGWAGV